MEIIIYSMSQKIKLITKASGKVLIAGGYGVLEENNYGLTLALNNNFYCICTQFSNDKSPTDIYIQSHQIGQHWHYKCNQNKEIKQSNGKNNMFVQNAIVWTLRYFDKQCDAGRIRLQILFDNNFISDRDIKNNDQYPTYNVPYNKTGLGSSACVLVSIVKNLTNLFCKQSLSSQQLNKIINLISQIANLSAQKKIGSNFDISTAVFGTHLYKNVLPHKLSYILHKYDRQQFQQLLQIDPQICYIEKPAQQLLGYIIDINKGADTRAMVKSFTTQLKKCSSQLQKQFYAVSKQIVSKLFQAITKNQLSSCKQINNQHRKLQRKYSQLTGVPVQPKDLTGLIDMVCQIEGVLYAICPGSGGYDAIFVLSNSKIDEQLSKTVKEYGSIRPVQILFGKDCSVSQQERNKILGFFQKLD